jgi:hypothetical protein
MYTFNFTDGTVLKGKINSFTYDVQNVVVTYNVTYNLFGKKVTGNIADHELICGSLNYYLPDYHVDYQGDGDREYYTHVTVDRIDKDSIEWAIASFLPFFTVSDWSQSQYSYSGKLEIFMRLAPHKELKKWFND